ncbi:hypothetical protein RHSIM_Rhsim02G0103600 [Rhododendron simsii]|uniref:Zinc knuckle CX2CX4HX4C domain-containing protein n=1 Tax=Rhododendron simsii TaxID=118357 RepID=A0A834H9Q1_RHOSS|nr:hypothetical protein RHSIM_Rhsim02G0103600 [Rhododendron simsii]
MAASPPLLEIAASTQMDDDLSRRFKSFTLTNDEQGEILLSPDAIVESMVECYTSLLGKVISQKPPNLVGLKNTMEMVWGNLKNFCVLAVGERDVGFKLGLRFVDMDEVVIPLLHNRDGRFLRICTSLNVTQPVKRGCMVKFPGANAIWIEFRYEKLPSFCRYCGKVGHEFLACDKRFLDMEDEARVSSHEEMLTDAFLVERSVVPKPNQSPTLEGNQLTPFMEQVLKKFTRLISTLTSHPVLAQPIPLSKPSPSPQGLNAPPIINHIMPLAQPSSPPFGPKITHSIQLVSKTLTQTSGINSPFPANTQIPPQTPFSFPIIPTYIPPLSILLNTTTLSLNYPSPILIDIPISDGPSLSKGRKKRGSRVGTPAPICRRVLGEIQGNHQPNPTPPPVPKQKLNSNGNRILENLENRVPNVAGVLAIPHGFGYDTRKKARGMNDGLALAAMDISPTVAEETRPNWSPPN